MYDVTDVFEMISRLFGYTLWLALFLVAIVYIFIKGNKAQKGAMLAAIAVFFLFINNSYEIQLPHGLLGYGIYFHL